MSNVSDPGEPPPPSFLLSISQYRLTKYWARPVFTAVGLIMDFHSIQSASIFLISVI
jgi:hypothetical protein